MTVDEEWKRYGDLRLTMKIFDSIIRIGAQQRISFRIKDGSAVICGPWGVEPVVVREGEGAEIDITVVADGMARIGLTRSDQ